MSPRSAAARVAAPRSGVTRTGTARTTADRAATPARPVVPKPSSTPKPRPTTGRSAGASAGSRPELRVVPSAPVRRVRAERVRAEQGGPFVLVVAGLLVVTALALLVLHIATGVDSIAAGDLREANASAAQDVQSLEQRVVANGTPAALAVAATAAGLVPAGSAAYLVIAPDGSSTMRGTVEPAPEPVQSRPVPADKD